MFKNIKTRKIILFLLIFSAVFSSVAIINSGVIIGGAASVDEEINALQKSIKEQEAQRNANSNKIKQLGNDIAAIKAEQADKTKEKKIYDELVSVIEDEIQNTEALISNIKELAAIAESEIETAQSEYDKSYELFLELMQFTYEDDNTNYLVMLLDAESFTDFLTRIDIISTMFEYTKNIITRLETDQKNLTTKREDHAEAMRQQEAYSLELASYKKDAEGLRQTASEELAKMSKDLAQAEAAQRQRELEDQNISAELKKAQNDLKAKQTEQEQQKYVGGTLKWPVDIYDKNGRKTYISSGFTWRTNPITKKQEFHNGIDLPAPYGSNIYAVNDGTIIMAVISSTGYGNYLMVDHGGGVSSLYAHNSKNLKKVGDKVTKGEVIAYIGSTGLSTGNHLHFGYYVNGDPVNPLGADKLVQP